MNNYILKGILIDKIRIFIPFMVLINENIVNLYHK